MKAPPIAYSCKNTNEEGEIFMYLFHLKNYDMNQNILIVTHNHQAIYFKMYHGCTPKHLVNASPIKAHFRPSARAK